jgi:shikimate kinase
MVGNHIVLVGAMGSGKTTIGTRLAEALGRHFVDSDAQIEEAHGGATGRELAGRKGVAWLHEAEASALGKALESTEPAIIAAAASIGDRPDLVAMLGATDLLVVLLEAEPDVLANRTETGDHRRPVDWNDMTQLLRQRRERLAAAADVVISTTSENPDSVVTRVLAEIAKRP